MEKNKTGRTQGVQPVGIQTSFPAGYQAAEAASAGAAAGAAAFAGFAAGAAALATGASNGL